MFPDGAAIKRKVLQRERVSDYRMISRYVLENAEYKLIDDEARGLMVEARMSERIIVANGYCGV